MIAVCSHPKLASIYNGPLVLTKLGALAYKLQLTAGSQCHPVSHVSQPKCAPESVPLQEMPIISECPVRQPIAIIYRRLIKHHNQPLVQLLIKLSDGLPPTWEDAPWFT